MRAIGLPYMEQKFDIDGASVHVRIEPEHDYIHLTGAEGGYVMLPHSKTNPDGVTTVTVPGQPPETVPPEAIVTISAQSKTDPTAPRKWKLKEHKARKAGLHDWKGGNAKRPTIITYDHGTTLRYRLPINSTALVPQPGLFIAGKEFKTEVPVDGAALGVLGAAMFKDAAGKKTLVFLSAADEDVLDVHAKHPGADEWELIGSFDMTGELSAGAQVHTTDPGYFSPDGKSFCIFLRAFYTGNDSVKARPLRGTISSVMAGDLAVNTVVFSLGAELHTFTDIHDLTPEPVASTPVEVRISSNRYLLHHAGGAGEYRNLMVQTHSVPVAIDYLPDGSEVPVSLATSGSLGVVTTWFEDSYDSWDYTYENPEFLNLPEEDWHVASTAVHNTSRGWYRTGSIRLRTVALKYGATEVIKSRTGDFEFANADYSDYVTVPRPSLASERDRKDTRAVLFIHALDARDDTALITELIDEKLLDPVDLSEIGNLTAKHLFRLQGADTVVTSAPISPSPISLYDGYASFATPSWGPSIHFLPVAGAYASRGDNEWVVSARADDVLKVATPSYSTTAYGDDEVIKAAIKPVLDAVLVQVNSDTATAAEFTIGAEPGFAVNPIRIF